MAWIKVCDLTWSHDWTVGGQDTLKVIVIPLLPNKLLSGPTLECLALIACLVKLHIAGAPRPT